MGPKIVHRKIRLYVGCALTHASPQFREEIEMFKHELGQEEHLEVLRFSDLGNFQRGAVYEQDINVCLASADAFVAFVDHPSLGLGIELAEAVKFRAIPTLITHHHSRVVSDLVLDLEHHFGQIVTVKPYERVGDVRHFLPSLIRRHDVLRHLVSAWPNPTAQVHAAIN